jgi:hypothetical protein
MRIWHGYGTDHSMNLVMIGQFKSSQDAKNAKELIEMLSNGLKDKIEPGSSHDRRDRYSDDVHSLLREANCYILSPSELEQFLYDVHIRVEGDKMILTTDESDVSAFLKVMIEKEAKVEVYSAHGYPDTEYGRGK